MIMAQRRFGPTRGAGTVVIEKPPQPQIEPAALGIAAYSGILQKGPTGKAFRVGNRTEFQWRMDQFEASRPEVVIRGAKELGRLGDPRAVVASGLEGDLAGAFPQEQFPNLEEGLPQIQYAVQGRLFVLTSCRIRLLLGQ